MKEWNKKATFQWTQANLTIYELNSNSSSSVMYNFLFRIRQRMEYVPFCVCYNNVTISLASSTHEWRKFLERLTFYMKTVSARAMTQCSQCLGNVRRLQRRRRRPRPRWRRRSSRLLIYAFSKHVPLFELLFIMPICSLQRQQLSSTWFSFS